MQGKNSGFIRIAAAGSYSAMIAVNAMANILPINNLTTGEISDLYPNLFTPAGITFSIWGLIYLLLGGYVLYQIGLFGKNADLEKEGDISRLSLYLIITSVANILWIFSWHHLQVFLSLVWMAVLLVFLIKASDLINKKDFTGKENLLVRVPFSIYFGWITVATIANITVFLVSTGWGGLGLPDQAWTVLILFTGAFIGILRARRDRSIPYLTVFIWAYLGILLRHLSSEGFAGRYPSIISAALISLILFILIIVALFRTRDEIVREYN